MVGWDLSRLLPGRVEFACDCSRGLQHDDVLSTQLQ